MPLAVKLGQSLFFSTNRDSFTDYMCIESLACSLLWDPTLQVPDTESIIQLKERERAKLANPFNATKLKFEKAPEKRKVKSSAVWDPSYEACGDIVEGSAASMAAKPLPKRRLEVRNV
jgi:hypothetical protein